MASLFPAWALAPVLAGRDAGAAAGPGGRVRASFLAHGKAWFLLLPGFLVFDAFVVAPRVFRWNGPLTGAALFLLTWGLAAALAARLRRRRLFKALTIAIALRFIFAYFEAFGSLALTGLGLVVSGGLILAVALAWDRARRKVTAAWGNP
jgi:hypothetical protein